MKSLKIEVKLLLASVFSNSQSPNCRGQLARRVDMLRGEWLYSCIQGDPCLLFIVVICREINQKSD